MQPLRLLRYLNDCLQYT